MTYKVKLSKKNQGTIPVAMLSELGLKPNQENQLVFYKDIDGKIVVASPAQIIQRTKGKLKVDPSIMAKLKNVSIDKIIEIEKEAAREYRANRLKNKSL